MEPDFDPNIMVPRGQDREMPVGLPEFDPNDPNIIVPRDQDRETPAMGFPEPVGIAGLPSFEEMTGGGGFPPEIPPEMIQSIEQTPPMPMPMPMAPEEVEQVKQVLPQLPPEQIKEVIPQLPPEQIKEVLPTLPPEVLEQVLPMLPPEIVQTPPAPMPAISSYFPPMPVAPAAPVSPKVSRPVRRPARRGNRRGGGDFNLGGLVNSMGSMPLKYTYK